LENSDKSIQIENTNRVKSPYNNHSHAKLNCTLLHDSHYGNIEHHHHRVIAQNLVSTIVFNFDKKTYKIRTLLLIVGLI